MSNLPEYILLIVDDSAEDRTLYRRLLQSDPAVAYRFVEFDNGEAALEWCHTATPDVILLDYLLPDADGLEILSHLWPHNSNGHPGEWSPLPVVMLTGQGDTGVAVQAMKHGAQDYLVKDTLTQDLLCRTVRHVIDRIQLLGQLRQQQQQQQQSDETLRLALEFAQLGCWDLDLLSDQIEWSDYHYRLLGLEPGSVEPSIDLWRDRIHPDDIAQTEAAIALAVCTQSLYQQEYRVVWDDGSVHWIASRGQTLNDSSGNPIRMLGVLIDISDRKQAELELEQLNADLEARVATRTAQLQDALRDREQQEQILQQAKEAAEAANQTKSLFLANMSHELRTPLNIILGFTQLLCRNQDLSLDQQDIIYTMHRSGEHLLSLINDILDLSKIEAGHTALEETHFDLRVLLQSLELMLRHRSHTKGLQFKLEIADAVPQYIAADITKLRQILINLLGNAIKFTAKGHVTLRVNLDHPHREAPNPTDSLAAHRSPLASSLPLNLHFEVEDTGVGIAPEELKTIFDAFVQSRAGRASAEGTGLGLTLCRRFAELMGGTISVDSMPFQGSTFHVYLPVARVQWVEGWPSEPYLQAIGLNAIQPTYRVLIVDQPCENRQLLTQLMLQLGLEVWQTSDAQEAVSLWQRHQPHLVWMNLQRPTLDGYTATQQIRLLEASQSLPQFHLTKIIALVDQVSSGDRIAALDAGCDDIVTQSLDVAYLCDKMVEHLDWYFQYPQPVFHPAVATANLPITLDDLSIMPDAWLQDFYQSSLNCDEEESKRLIQQIPAAHTILIAQLKQLLHNYQFETIKHLLQNHRAIAPHVS